MFYNRMVKALVLICTVLLEFPPSTDNRNPRFICWISHWRPANLKYSSPINISRNPGYDNQPYFLGEDDLLYARTRNGQTDIARYSLSEKKTTWLSDTPGGSEYSPVKIPGKKAVSSIRLDTDGFSGFIAIPSKEASPSSLSQISKSDITCGIARRFWCVPFL